MMYFQTLGGSAMLLFNGNVIAHIFDLKQCVISEAQLDMIRSYIFDRLLQHSCAYFIQQYASLRFPSSKIKFFKTLSQCRNLASVEALRALRSLQIGEDEASVTGGYQLVVTMAL